MQACRSALPSRRERFTSRPRRLRPRTKVSPRARQPFVLRRKPRGMRGKDSPWDENPAAAKRKVRRETEVRPRAGEDFVRRRHPLRHAVSLSPGGGTLPACRAGFRLPTTPPRDRPPSAGNGFPAAIPKFPKASGRNRGTAPNAPRPARPESPGARQHVRAVHSRSRGL